MPTDSILTPTPPHPPWSLGALWFSNRLLWGVVSVPGNQSIFFFCYFMRSHCCVTTTLFFFSRGKLGIMAIVSECDACSYVMGDVADLYFRSPSFTLEIGECCHPWSSMDTTFLYFFIFQFFLPMPCMFTFWRLYSFKISLYLWPSNHICKRSAQHFRICVTLAALIKQIFF